MPTSALPNSAYQSQKGVLLCKSCFSVDYSSLPSPDVIFTDPPWNDAVLTQFYTTAKISPIPSIREWLENFSSFLSSFNSKLVIVEMGLETAPILLSAMRSNGFKLFHQIFGGYGKKEYPTRYTLTIWAKTSLPISLNLPQRELFGMDTPEFFIKQFPSSWTLFDPCMGNGHYTEMALKYGMNAMGTEIVPVKFSRALSRASHFSPFTQIN